MVVITYRSFTLQKYTQMENHISSMENSQMIKCNASSNIQKDNLYQSVMQIKEQSQNFDGYNSW